MLRQRAQRIEALPLRFGDLALVRGRAHVGEVRLPRALERPGLGFEPGVRQVEIVHFVQVLDHFEHGQHVTHAMRHRQVWVHLLLAYRDVLGQGLAGEHGEVQHVELVAQIAHDGLLQLAVIPQAAGPGELHQHVGAQLQRLDVVAQDVLERRAHHVAGVARAQLDGALRGLRQCDEIGVQHVFDEEFERDVVVAVAEERHARAGVAFALGARLLRQRGQQLERAAPRAHHHAGAAHLAVAVGVQRVHRVAFRLRRQRSPLSSGSAGCR